MICKRKNVNIAIRLCKYDERYEINVENGKLKSWKIIEPELDTMSPDEIDKYTILEKYDHSHLENSDEICCPICYENENLYKLPCSTDSSEHIVCGDCIIHLRFGRRLKCPFCTTQMLLK